MCKAGPSIPWRPRCDVPPTSSLLLRVEHIVIGNDISGLRSAFGCMSTAFLAPPKGMKEGGMMAGWRSHLLDLDVRMSTGKCLGTLVVQERTLHCFFSPGGEDDDDA